MRVQRLVPKLTMHVQHPTSVKAGAKATAYVELGNDGDGPADVTLVEDLPAWLSLDWGTRSVPPHKGIGREAAISTRGLAPGLHQHSLKFSYTSLSGEPVVLTQPVALEVLSPNMTFRLMRYLPLLLLPVIAIAIWLMMPKAKAPVQQKLVWAYQCVSVHDWRRAVDNLEIDGEPIDATNLEVMWLLGWCYKELPEGKYKAVRYLNAYLKLDSDPDRTTKVRRGLEELGAAPS